MTNSDQLTAAKRLALAAAVKDAETRVRRALHAQAAARDAMRAADDELKAARIALSAADRDHLRAEMIEAGKEYVKGSPK